MNTEQKARAYDKVREKIALRFGSNVAEDIFSEFEMSEDERIRKSIIAILNNYVDSSNTFKPKMIAWLEKQGEQNTNYKTMSVKFICKKDWHGIGDYCYGKVYNGYPCEKEQRGYDVYDDNHIPTFCDEDFIDEYFRIVTEEKQGEQKPADKVEPKYQNGQWIVWQNKCYKVNYNGCGYELIDQNGLRTSLEYGTVDESARLWTIQDAKDGDVLSYRDGQWIFIYKKQVDDNSFHYYSLYSTIHQDLTIDDSAFTLLIDGIVPATQEQRNILFQKMKEDGLEWDAEKKELKEVEQKLAECKQETKPNGGIVYEDFNESDGYYKVNLAYLSKLQVELIENLVASWQNPTNNTAELSEEDKDYFDAIIAKLEVTQDDAALTDNQMEFLKSLKGRIWTKQQWSEEDEKMLNGIIDEIEANKSDAPSYDVPVYEGFLKWLESLKQRIGG